MGDGRTDSKLLFRRDLPPQSAGEVFKEDHLALGLPWLRPLHRNRRDETSAVRRETDVLPVVDEASGAISAAEGAGRSCPRPWSPWWQSRPTRSPWFWRRCRLGARRRNSRASLQPATVLNCASCRARGWPIHSSATRAMVRMGSRWEWTSPGWRRYRSASTRWTYAFRAWTAVPVGCL